MSALTRQDNALALMHRVLQENLVPAPSLLLGRPLTDVQPPWMALDTLKHPRGKLHQKGHLLLLVVDLTAMASWFLSYRLSQEPDRAHFVLLTEKKQVCAMCSDKNRSTTKYICESCNIPLHLKCFKEFHCR